MQLFIMYVYDALAIYVPRFQSTLESLRYRYQIRALCHVFALFLHLRWLSIQQIKDRCDRNM